MVLHLPLLFHLKIKILFIWAICLYKLTILVILHITGYRTLHFSYIQAFYVNMHCIICCFYDGLQRYTVFLHISLTLLAAFHIIGQCSNFTNLSTIRSVRIYDYVDALLSSQWHGTPLYALRQRVSGVTLLAVGFTNMTIHNYKSFGKQHSSQMSFNCVFNSFPIFKGVQPMLFWLYFYGSQLCSSFFTPLTQFQQCAESQLSADVAELVQALKRCWPYVWDPPGCLDRQMAQPLRELLRA